jgi:hypothetical protein
VAVQTKQLRIMSTVLLAFAVGQAGLGAGYLDDESRGLLIAHLTNAFAVVVLSVLAAVFGLTARRSGAPGWVFFLPVALVVASLIQLSLGLAEVRGGHVFFGVLFLCLVTTYCSYTWRLLPADGPVTPAGGPRATGRSTGADRSKEAGGSPAGGGSHAI